MKSALSMIAIVVGIVLLLASLVWALLFPAASGWTEEKSLRLAELSSRAHILVGEREAARSQPSMHRGRNLAEIEAEFKQVTAELEQLGAEADGKIQAPKTAATIMRWAGFAFVIAGGLVVFASRGG